MLKFNNDHIFTGYLKQLLSSFNLPKCDVYKNDNEIINKHLYIKDDFLQECNINAEDKGIVWKQKHFYKYNVKDINYTKNLIIKNNIYDTYTHNYLGEYLRFLRDYRKINLMPLYNCFSNEICTNIKITSSKFNFNSEDEKFKIYKIIVKPYKQYTIAIDCDEKVEMCCSFYGKYQYIGNSSAEVEAKIRNIADKTYFSIKGAKFNQPFVYKSLDKLLQIKSTDAEVISAQQYIKENVHDLKLFLKVPAKCKSSITVLEGNYEHWNDSYVGWYEVTPQNTSGSPEFNFGRISNKSIINYQHLEKMSQDNSFTLCTRLQLLAFNTGISYPFADRLIEYLVGNAVSSEDDIADNVKRVQKVLGKLYCPEKDFYGDYYGIWENSIRPHVYDEINNKKDTFEINHDILGYVDKTAEKYICADSTISNVDIYEEE